MVNQFKFIRVDRFFDDINTMIDNMNKAITKDIQYYYTNKELTTLTNNTKVSERNNFIETMSTTHVRDMNHAMNLFDIIDRTNEVSREEDVSIFERITITPY